MKKEIIEKLGITAGKWKFDVRPKGKHCHLSGRNGDTVMDFRRWGMQNAQPFFQRDGIIHPVEVFCVPVPGEEHHEWTKKIDHPDAKVIEAAPEMLEFIAKVLSDSRTMLRPSLISEGYDLIQRIDKEHRSWSEIKELLK